MVFLDVVVLAVLIGLCLGGRLSRLARLELRGIGLLYAAIGLQLAAFPAGVFPWGMNDVVARVLWLASYVLLGAAAVMNRHIRGVTGVAAGMAMNVTAFVVNGGHMPARARALAETHRSYRIHNNSISLAQPHLAALVDRWAAPAWLPFANVFSVGDIAIAVGVFVVVICAMRPRLAFLRTAAA
jgi:hypothetical protein